MSKESIKEKLIDELSEHLSRSGRITDHLRNTPPSDWEELATFRENDEVVEALDEMTRIRINEIKQALRRMDTDDWGSCETCGEDIGAQRLEAVPTATQCINCAEKAEQAG